MQLFSKKEHLGRWIMDAKNGDSRAQRSIYEHLSAKMYAVCLRYMGDKEAAQDVLQDGFVTLFNKLSTYSGEGSFEGWARRIFTNTALMVLRQHDVMRDSGDIEKAYGLFDEGESVIQRISYQELLRKVSELPPGFRTVFNMYVIEGYSHKEIAEALGIGEATSRSQLQRARVMLQEMIKSNGRKKRNSIR